MNLLRSTGLRQSIFTVMGNLVGTAISAIAIILFIRILGPEKYGEFSVGFAIVLILVKINDFGLNQAIIKFTPKAKTQLEKNFIYNLSLKYKLLISMVLFLIGVLFYKPIASSLKLTEPLIILLSFSFGLATVYFEYILSILQSLHLFKKAVLISIAQAVVKLIAATALFFIGTKSILAPYFWYIFAPFISVAFLPVIIPKWIKFNLTLKNKSLRKKIVVFAGHASIGLIASGIIENIDILFVQKYLTVFETGLYGGVSRIALLFALMAFSLGNVLNARVARYHSARHLKVFFKKAALFSSFVILSFALFIPLVDPLIYYSIGAEYLAGNQILIILTAGSFLTLAAIPFISIFFSLNANWYFSLSGVLQLIIVLAGNYFFVPEYGLMGAAWTRFATRLFALVFTIITGLIVYRKQYGQAAR